MTRLRIPLLLTLVLVALAVAATPTRAPEAANSWSVDDILLAEYASQFRLSPDGQWVVWVKDAMNPDENARVSNLLLSSLTQDKEIQLTRGKNAHSDPQWSPDGALVAFLSTRPLPASDASDDEGRDRADEQLWLINPFGGEPWPLTQFAKAVETDWWADRGPIIEFGWKDNDTLVLAAREDPTYYEQETKERKDTSQAIEDAAHEPPVRLFLLNVKDQSLKRLTHNDDWIDLLSLSPDGHWAVTRHIISLSFEYDNRIRPATYLTNLETGESTRLFPDNRVFPDEVEWTPDSRGFYFTAEYSSDRVYLQAFISRVYYFDLTSRALSQVDLDWDKGVVNNGDVPSEDGNVIQATSDGFIALLADGVRFQPARYTRQGDAWTRTPIDGEHIDHVFGWSLGPDGNSLVLHCSRADLPMQWYRAHLAGAHLRSEAQLTHLNPDYAGKPIHHTEVIHWTGARQQQVEGILYYPLDYQPGKRYPLILTIHGGPTWASFDTWEQGTSRPKILLAQKGAFQLEVNYHGSSNYGLDWVESIGNGNFYDLEIPDLEAGVNYLIGRGLADPDKLATMGWSNGAILSIALVTKDHRFKAISAGAGDVEYFGDWGLVSFGAAWDNYYFGKPPYEDPELYVRKAPFFHLKDVTAATIIYTGTEDRAVGPGNAWNHFRVMQQATQTPVRLVIFPGEPHGPEHYDHQRRKIEEDLAWFDRYLFGNTQPPDEVLKPGSPLDAAFKRTRIHRAGTNYGVAVRATVTPEVVNYQGLSLGRFEVTRAQYAAFDSGYRFPVGTENFPANGISFQQAQAFCIWLSKLTGEVYRLPRESEVESVYTEASDDENTLDYWAGYPVNPDDAARLEKKIGGLPGGAPLLEEVGRFAGLGKEDLVFDLGGNVAEWALGADGGGVLLGGSADRPADPKTRHPAAGEAYRGFRVMRGEPKD